MTAPTDTTSHDCQRIVRAENVSALIVNGFLASTQASGPHRDRKCLRYDLIDYCQSPTCEKVFRAVKAQEGV